MGLSLFSVYHRIGFDIIECLSIQWVYYHLVFINTVGLLSFNVYHRIGFDII